MLSSGEKVLKIIQRRGCRLNMISEIKHYLSVYKRYLSTSTSEAMSFRTSFVLLIIMDLLFTSSAYFKISFIYDHVSVISHWDRSELMFFTAFMLCLNALNNTIISTNFWMFSEDLKTGNLDYILLKPVSSIFIVFFRYLKPSGLPNIILTHSLLIYFGVQVGLDIIEWFMLPLLLLLSFVLYSLVQFVMSCAMFWLIEGMGINFLRMQMQEIARWPNFIFEKYTRVLFMTVIPVLLVGSGPVYFIFDRSYWYMVPAMIVACIILYYVLHFLWNRGLVHYDSASS